MAAELAPLLVVVLCLLLFSAFGVVLRARIQRPRNSIPTLADFPSITDDTLGRYREAGLHYEMRELAEEFPELRSERFSRYWIYCMLHLTPRYRQYQAAFFFQLLWMRHGFPGPALEICQSNQQVGAKHPFSTIAAYLSRDLPVATRVAWTAEVTGAFLRATTSEAMWTAAQHYPILLRPRILREIAIQIETYDSVTGGTPDFEKLQYLQRFHDMINGGLGRFSHFLDLSRLGP
jgi:hypothetical protein